ncbi:MAG: hypothetical protein ACOCRO_02390 [Halanaerobiales bacterium]
MSKTKITVITLIIFLSLSIAVIPVKANEKKDDELEWRMELIKASREMMDEESEENRYHHRVATVFTTFGEANLNTGLRVAPSIWQDEKRSLHLMGEIYYLRKEDDFANFISFFKRKNNRYIGGGAELTDRANYQIFAGWEVTNHLFLEIRAINTEGQLDDSDIYPVAGFQLKY